MRAGYIIHFRPDGAYLGGLSAVETCSFVENAAAHSFFLYVVIVALYKRCLLVAHFLGKRVDVFLADSGKAVGTPVLIGTSGLCNGIGFVVALFVHVFAEIFVVYFVAVFAFCCGSGGLSQLKLNTAMVLDGFVGYF